MGRRSRDISESGNPKAVNVTAAYTAPEAPREGNISMTGRPNKLPLETALAAVAVAADALVVAAAPPESCDTSRGNIILVAAM